MFKLRRTKMNLLHIDDKICSCDTIFRNNLYINSTYSVSFAHFKKKIIFEQWENLDSYYLIMTRIAKDVLNASSFDVSNERLFSIANKIYDSHKFYHSATIRVKMIIRQHDDKKNEWKLKNVQSNLKKKEKMTISKIREEKEIRDQVLRDETQDYINDVNETLSSTIQVNKTTKYVLLTRHLINITADKQEKKANSFRKRIYTNEDEFEKQNYSAKMIRE